MQTSAWTLILATPMQFVKIAKVVTHVFVCLVILEMGAYVLVCLVLV